MLWRESCCGAQAVAALLRLPRTVSKGRTRKAPQPPVPRVWAGGGAGGGKALFAGLGTCVELEIRTLIPWLSSKCSPLLAQPRCSKGCHQGTKGFF